MSDRPFVPDDFTVPRELVTEAFRLEPLDPRHNEQDLAAWSSSVEHIRATPGFEGRSWPPDRMTPAENLADLRRHADDFARRTGFTYTVIDRADGSVAGCVYVYPPRKEGADTDAHVSSWVRADRAPLDRPLHRAVTDWLAADWPFARISYADRPAR